MIRIATYTLLVVTILTGVTVKQRLEAKIIRQEYNYLYKAAETKIRLHYIQQRLLAKEIVRLREVLGQWNEELNPYE